MMYKLDKGKDSQQILKTNLRGKALMFHPLLNKANAFTAEERVFLKLDGKLPPVYEDLQKQVDRAYLQYCRFNTDEAKSIYLHVLYNTNEILFYALITSHILEITDKLYTPTVGITVKDYSMQYRHPRGMFISYHDKDKIETILANRTNPELDLIVISDGEAILGIGDQGIGGMGIPVAKAAMHVASGGISPYRIAPLFVDVGTNNASLQEDSFYLGIRENRLKQAEYRNFMKNVMDKIFKTFPNVVVHFEDFSKINARWLLQTYGKTHACFNDDIQGTAVIVLSAIITALRYKQEKISDQRIVLVGPGAAGLGIIESLVAYMSIHRDKDENHAKNIWLVGRKGLVMDGAEDEYLAPYTRSNDDVQGWDDVELKTVIKKVRPTILIGVSGQANLFDHEVIQDITSHVDKPIILPLSNPSNQSECIPQDVRDATDNRVFMATGSPFAVESKDNVRHDISQCNNLYAFPGIATGMIACQAKRLTQAMIISVAEKISDFTYKKYKKEMLITPKLSDLQQVGQIAAQGLIDAACANGDCHLSQIEAMERLAKNAWSPRYPAYEYDPDLNN